MFKIFMKGKWVRGGKNIWVLEYIERKWWDCYWLMLIVGLIWFMGWREEDWIVKERIYYKYNYLGKDIRE